MTAVSVATGRLSVLAAVPRWAWIALLVAATAVLYLLFAGQHTIHHDDDAPVFHAINDLREWIDENRKSGLLVVTVTAIREAIKAIYAGFEGVLLGLSWVGLTAVGAALGLATGGWRAAALIALGFVSFGVLGLWEPAVQTLALTLTAVVLSLLIGIPLGILSARSNRVHNALQPFLDVMQIMPTFAYLAPVALFFLIGPATAAIVTMIYAVPPAIRITELGIRGVAPTTIEAATSLGATRRQILTKVQLPMARRTIILGVNQTIMMALSMVVITVLVDAPGLGKNIIHALQQSDVGLAFDAGVAVVILAIVLDRLTTYASERMDPSSAGARPTRFADRRWFRWAVMGWTATLVVLGVLLVGQADFPSELGFSFRGFVNDIVDWMALNLYPITEAAKNVVTTVLINPIQTVLTSSPWWLVVAFVVGLAFLVSGRRPAIIAFVCLVLVLALQMWEHSMETLTQVMVAATITLLLGLVLGIAAARSDRASRALRPLLDAAQTMPAFVYLIPAIALFGPTRFTAIVAALIYAVPPVIRLVEVGIRTVPGTVREAAMSAGATDRQMLWKVDLPLARPALLVAANQGIILVLAMVVVGGLVGGGALGYDVVAGFARRDFFGEGLAAGIAIVLLGILLDRITQGAGTRKRGDEPLPRAAPAGAH